MQTEASNCRLSQQETQALRGTKAVIRFEILFCERSARVMPHATMLLLPRASRHGRGMAMEGHSYFMLG